MSSNEFYNEFNKKIQDLSLDEIKKLINNVIRKIPETKYDEILKMFDNNLGDISETEIIKTIKKYEEKFRLIDEFELFFHVTGYEDYSYGYSYWSDNWVFEYSDDDNVGEIIEDAVFYAVDLINNKQYEYAKKIIDLILDTNYQVLDDDGGDVSEISLNELQQERLINVDVNNLCLYAIYATYKVSHKNTRAKNIYEYFKNESFKNLSIESSFKLGTEMLEDIDEFWDDWLTILSENSGDVTYRLMKEAFEYNDYKNYNKYLENITKNQPKIYLDLFDFLLKNGKNDEIVSIGNKSLNELDKDLIIRNDIALYLANIDSDNREKYLLESFISNTDVPNLLRIINNDYYINHKDEINKIINSKEIVELSYYSQNKTENVMDKYLYMYLQFFLGNFNPFYEECLKTKDYLGWSHSFIQTAVYLWLLVFNKNSDSTKIMSSLLSNVSYTLGLDNNLGFLDDDYFNIWMKWKERSKVDALLKDQYLEWLCETVDKRVDAIVGGSYRKSYSKAALLVVSLGEVLESRNIQNKQDFINIYLKRYPRRSSFVKEIKSLL